MMAVFNRLYSRNCSALRAYTQTRYGTDSLWVPETMGWDGNARGTINSDFVNDIYSTGTEAAYNMYLQYRYTNDLTYLRDVAYPYMREALRFYQNRFQLQNNQWVMPNSNAHETYWDVRNAITDLAAVRLLFPLTIQCRQWTAGRLAERRDQPGPVPGRGPRLPAARPAVVADPQRRERRAGAGVAVRPDRERLPRHADRDHHVERAPAPVRANDHVHAARLGLGNQAFEGMKTLLQKYQNYPNGMSSNTNGVFEYLGIHLAA